MINNIGNERIPLLFTCPGYFQSKCNQCDGVMWIHESCKKKLWINEYGNVYCDGGCSIPNDYRFIQYWRFNCKAQHTGEYTRLIAVSDLLYVLGNISYSLANENKKDIISIRKLIKEFIKNISIKWVTDDS